MAVTVWSFKPYLPFISQIPHKLKQAIFNFVVYQLVTGAIEIKFVI